MLNIKLLGKQLVWKRIFGVDSTIIIIRNPEIVSGIGENSAWNSWIRVGGSSPKGSMYLHSRYLGLQVPV